jgi:hypothetical protein
MQLKNRFDSRVSPLLLAGVLLFPAVGASGAEDLPGKDKTSGLPLTEVILYSSGVGYFQRDGQVDGKASVELQFKVDDINDLLKSMVVQDLNGGQVSTVTYGSRDPLTKTLKSFGIDLTSNPTLGQLLDQVRAERVEVLRPSPLKGTILGVERKTEHLDDKKIVETESLNLLTDEGLLSLPLSQLQRIKLLNEQLNSELHQALEVLATGHDTQKKAVVIRFEGDGKRKVSVAYIAQTPVWKTSYRLVLDEKEKPYLQGWAIVENTSDDDWESIRLSLVSGRPISFAMDLYQPLYTTRPVVQPELYTSLRPQVYGEAMEGKTEKTPTSLAASGMAGGFGGGGIGGGIGGGGGGIGAQGGTAPRQGVSPAFMGRAMALSDKGAQLHNFFGYENVTAAAQGTQAGELFQYVIKTPVSLARQKSAMLPIVSQNVEGEKVSIYNEQAQAKYPLNGFRLKNTTGLHLMQGPITVFDANAYAGDARMEDLAAGQERLISYALDVKIEVEPQIKEGPQELVAVKIRKGTLLTTHKVSEEKAYLVRNRDQHRKAVLIEHPFRADFELVAPKEATERTREVYRFLVTVDADKTQKLVVREQKQLGETVELVNVGSDLIAYYLKAPQVSSKVKESLGKVVSLRDQLNQTTAEKARRERRVNEIAQEQSRIRENMNRLSQSSELYTRYVKKLDQQETELESLRKEIEGLKDTEAKRQVELNDYLLNLDVE